MKKTYINPSMEIVKIATQTQVLTMSGGQGQLSSGSASEWGAREDDGDFDW